MYVVDEHSGKQLSQFKESSNSRSNPLITSLGRNVLHLAKVKEQTLKHLKTYLLI